MTPRRIENPTRAQAIAFANDVLSEQVARYLGDLLAVASGTAKPPPLPPGPGLSWERVDDAYVAREAARLGAWKLAQLAEITRLIDEQGCRAVGAA